MKVLEIVLSQGILKKAEFVFEENFIKSSYKATTQKIPYFLREMLRKKDEFSLDQSYLIKNFGVSEYVPTMTVMTPESYNVNDSFYYLYVPDNYEIEHVYHESVKYLLSNGTLNNTIPGELLLCNYEGLSLSKKEALIYRCDMGDISETTKQKVNISEYNAVMKAIVSVNGSDLFLTSLKDYSVSVGTNRFFNFFAIFGKENNSKSSFKIKTTLVNGNFLTGTGKKAKIENCMISHLSEYIAAGNTSLSFFGSVGVKFDNTTNESFDSLETNLIKVLKAAMYIKEEGDLTTIMSILIDKLKTVGALFSTKVLITKSGNSSERKASLNQMFVGANRDLLIHFIEKTPGVFDVYSGKIEDSFYASNNYSKFIGDGLNDSFRKIEGLVITNEIKFMDAIDLCILDAANNADIEIIISNKLDVYHNLGALTFVYENSSSTQGAVVKSITQLSPSVLSYKDLFTKVLGATFELEATPLGIAGLDGKALDKIGQTEIIYNDSSVAPDIKLRIDLLKLGVDGTTLSEKKENADSFEIVFNGISNSYSLKVDDTITEYVEKTKTTEKFFTPIVSKDEIILNWNGSGVILNGMLNKVGFILRKGTAVTYFEEMYFNKNTKDLVVETFSTNISSLDGYKDNITIKIDIEGTKDIIENSSDDNYEVYLSNGTGRYKLGKFSTVYQTYNKTFSFSKDVFKHNGSNLETNNLYAVDWEVEIERIVTAGKKTVYKNKVTANPDIDAEDITGYLLNKDLKRSGIPEYTDGFFIIESSMNDVRKDILPYLKTIEIRASGVANTVLNQGFDYKNPLVFEEIIYGSKTNPKSIFFEVRGLETQPTSKILNLINSNVVQTLSIMIEFYGGKKVELTTADKLGELFTLVTPSLDTSILPNKNYLLDPNNKNAMVFYDNNVNFKISDIDPKARFYEIFQDDNSIFKERPLISDTFSYTVEQSYIDYDKEGINTKPLKFSTKIFLETESGQTTRQSQAAYVNAIIRKRPSVPVAKNSQGVSGIYVDKTDLKIVDGINNFEVGFDDMGSRYNNKRIYKIDGSFTDFSQKEIKLEKQIQRTVGGTWETVRFYAAFEQTEGIKNQILTKSKVELDLLSLTSTKIVTVANEVVLPGDIVAVKNEVAGVKNFSMKQILEAYVLDNKGFVDARELQIVLKMNSYDETLKDSSLDYLKNTVGMDDVRIAEIKALCTSESNFVYLDIIKLSELGVSVSGMSNVFEQADTSEKALETLQTFYTYSDNSKFKIEAGSRSDDTQVIQVKFPGNNIFSDITATKKENDGSEYLEGTFDITLFNNAEASIQVREKTDTKVSSPIPIKIIKIDKDKIVPNISFENTQDSVNNLKKYNSRDIVAEIVSNTSIKKYIYYFTYEGKIVGNKTELIGTNGNSIITCPASFGSGDYKLEILPYDLSGRLLKKFEYVIGFVTTDLEPVDLTVDNSTEKEMETFIVNDSQIEISFGNQNQDNIAKYKVIINNSYEKILNQSYGKNTYSFSHIGGSKLPAGTYSVEVIPVNILGNETGSKKIYIKYAGRPTGAKTKMKLFSGNNINNLNCEITSYDTENTDVFHYLLSYSNKRAEATSKILESKNTTLEFESNGEIIEDDILPDTLVNLKVYCKNQNGFYDTSLYAEHNFMFRKAPVSVVPDDVLYLSLTSDSKPVFLLKDKKSIALLEARNLTQNENYSTVKNNIYISNPVTEGDYRYAFRFTDVYGNVTEIERDIKTSFNASDTAAVHAMLDETIVDTNRGSFDIRPYFNLNFGSVNQDVIRYTTSFGSEGFIRTSTVSNIPIPYDLKSGIYFVKLFAFDSKTSGYNYLIKDITIHFVKEQFAGPTITNRPYSSEESTVEYTNKETAEVFFAVANGNLKYIDKVKIKYSVYDFGSDEAKESKDVELDKTSVSYSIPFVFEEGKNVTCFVEIKTTGLNNKDSETSYFTFNVLRKEPKPLYFDLNPNINLHYDNKKNGTALFKFKDHNDPIQALVNVKFNLNGVRETVRMKLGDVNVPLSEDGYFTYGLRNITEQGQFRLMAIGQDKAGNYSTSDPDIADNLTTQDFANIDSQYLYFDKIIDTVKPIVLNDNSVHVRENVSGVFNNINVYFDLPEADLCYLEFEVFNMSNDIKTVLMSGNSFPYHDILSTIQMPSTFIKGINNSVGAGGNKAYIRKIIESDTYGKGFENVYLALEEVTSGDIKIGLTVVDLAGNKSDQFVVPIKVLPPETLSPVMLAPVNPYTKDSNLMFSWSLDSDNVNKWEYQFVHLDGNEQFSNMDNDWTSLRESVFRYRIANGKERDGEYGFRVRGVIRGIKQEIVDGVLQDVNVDVRTNYVEYRIFVDREIPEGIRFLNNVYTQDSSFLDWTWEYISDENGKRADGVYVTFNPNRSIDQWEKLDNKSEYISNVSRPDGVYTLYAKTFDKAGNIGEKLYSSAIYIDTTPPKAVELNQVNNIITNKIPTITWKSNLNIIKRYWMVIKEEIADQFLIDYEALKLKDNTVAYEFIWSKTFIDENLSKVSTATQEFAAKYGLSNKRNNFLTANEIKICSENGIKEDGLYRFLIVGREDSGLFTDGSDSSKVPNSIAGVSYVKITYDTKSVDVNDLSIIKPLYPVVEEKRPLVEILCPIDITKVVFNLKTNSTRETLLSETINTIERVEGNSVVYKYKPAFNIPFGEYIIECNCYDDSGNLSVIDKLIIVTSTDYNTFEDSVTVYVPEINASLKIKSRRGSETYVIESMDINKSSVLYYREVKDNLIYEEEWSMIEFNKTELNLSDKVYDFKLVGYTVKEI